jgi:hypothetical protein
VPIDLNKDMSSRRELMLSDLLRDMPMNIDSSVLPEDRTLVRNVVACLCTLRQQKMIHTVDVERVKNGYHVIARIADGDDFDLDTGDLELINSVSPLRVTSSSVERRAGKLQFRIRILDAGQPVNITETSVSHIRRRRRITHNTG